MVLATQTQEVQQRPIHGEVLLQSKNTEMQRVLNLARGVAPTPTTVLLVGESGTGKEVLARYMHLISPRRDASFVAVNCGAIPETLMESELFGHEKGAFSGATARRAGRFEQAHGGTLLLDEISEMPFEMQAKLLRVIQEGEVDRLGSNRPVSVDVRIIATTNQNLKQLVQEGRFREDLYYRINVFPVCLPPLRDRKEDLETLIGILLQRIANRFGQAQVQLTDEAMNRLTHWVYPGNVRELNNILERSVILAQGEAIQARHVILDGPSPDPTVVPAGNPSSAPCEQTDEPKSLRELERNAILNTLALCNGNRTHASERLGISIRTLRNRLKEYRQAGISIPEARNSPTPTPPVNTPTMPDPKGEIQEDNPCR